MTETYIKLGKILDVSLLMIFIGFVIIRILCKVESIANFWNICIIYGSIVGAISAVMMGLLLIPFKQNSDEKK